MLKSRLSSLSERKCGFILEKSYFLGLDTVYLFSHRNEAPMILYDVVSLLVPLNCIFYMSEKSQSDQYL